MMLTIVSALAMAMMTAVLLFRGKRSRRLAWMTAAVCVMQLGLAEVLTPALFPVLTALSLLAQAGLLGCCVAALRRDAAAERARRRRHERLVRDLHAALNPPQLLPVPQKASNVIPLRHVA